jgi:peroxiredoxin
VTTTRILAGTILAAMLLACAPSRTPDVAPDDVRSLGQGARLTVIVFFSAHCPCQAAHDPRLLALHARYSARGVKFVAIDAEVTAASDVDAREAKARNYPFPILSDPDGRLADELGAEMATFTVVIDEHGRVLYRGGIDSDRSHLTDDATPWLDDALEALLDGKAPKVASSKALGCALQRK